MTGKAHFKNKFCANCRKGIAVPTSRVRAMATEMRHVYQNSLRAGFWKRVPQSIGGGEVRIANNTITCDGPWLVVYRAGCGVPALPWEPMPTEWVSEDGVVQLSVAKGTLVPMAEMGVRSGKRANASYAATAPSAGPKRQRRAHAKTESLGVDALPESLRRKIAPTTPPGQLRHPPPFAPAAVAAAPVPPPLVTAAPVAANSVVPAILRSARSDSERSEAATQPGSPEQSPAAHLAAAALERKLNAPLPTRQQSMPPNPSRQQSMEGISPGRRVVQAAHASASINRPATLVVSSPTLSKQSSSEVLLRKGASTASTTAAVQSPAVTPHAAAAAMPGDPAQLAVRLVAAHEHIAGLLEAALRQDMPMRRQLTNEQAASLYEQLTKTRSMIEDSVALARPPQMRPPVAAAAVLQQPARQPSGGGVQRRESEENAAFASLVEAATTRKE